MSSDITPDAPRHIRCEAIASSSIAKPVLCHRSHGTIMHHPGPGRADPLADDPAVLIGLAIAHVRQGKGMTGTVPDAVTSRLQVHADHSNPACRLMLDWLGRRNSDLLETSAPSQASAPSLASRSSPTRPLALRSGGTTIGKRLPIRGRLRTKPGRMPNPVRSMPEQADRNLAMIAATAEGRIDE